MRKIIVNNEEYKYKIGKHNIVISYSSKKWVVNFRDIFPNEDIERAIYKKYFHIKPSDIARYIQSH